MLDAKTMYHEDGECCHGHGHPHGDGECCHGHSHEHEHADGTRHCHEHDHTGDHSHDHAPEALSADEKVALLAYMIRHNGQHLDELHSLALQLPGEPGVYLNDAVTLLAQSNERLVKAFYALQSEQVRAADDDRD